jgi:hypothetical protein
MNRLSWWPLLVIALALAADLAVVADLGLPWRGIVVFAFLLLGPGMPFVQLLGIGGLGGELTLAIALSLAIDTIVAGVMVVARAWSAGIAFSILIAVAVAGALLDLYVMSRGRGTEATE